MKTRNVAYLTCCPAKDRNNRRVGDSQATAEIFVGIVCADLRTGGYGGNGGLNSLRVGEIPVVAG